jgi:hypothetical protein
VAVAVALGVAVNSSDNPAPHHDPTSNLSTCLINLAGASLHVTDEAAKLFRGCVKSSRGTYTEPVEAISGLPAGVRLRPWARLFDVPDRVTISGFWWSTQTSRPEAGRVVRRRAGTLV